MLHIASVTESELLDGLEAAVAASLLEEATDGSGRFRFVHALVNQTLYDVTGPDTSGSGAPEGRRGARGSVRRRLR